MRELLIVVPDDTRGEHGDRAFQVASEFLEADLQAKWGLDDVRLIVGDRGGMGDPSGAIVFNSPMDRFVLAEMRAKGRPSLYSLGLGATADGLPADPNARSADFVQDRKIKIRLATHVQVDTQGQANAASQWTGAGRSDWTVIGPACVQTYPARNVVPRRTLLMLGQPEGWDALGWARRYGNLIEETDSETHAINQAAQRTNLVILWSRRSYYADNLLTAAATGTPIAALRQNICAELDQAEWYSAATGPQEAVERAFTWDQVRVDDQVHHATADTWRGWAEAALHRLFGPCAEP